VTQASTGSGAGRRSRRAATRIRPTGRIDPTPAAADLPPTGEPDAEAVAEPAETSFALRPAFAHASEAEMARILDFYQVRWEYEPHVFPVVWNLDGTVVESFAPDFWLPDLDLYLEMTTLRQKLVRKKNRKLRRVLELYPDLRVKLFYARDFRALMLKFGKLGLVAELSGTPGQVVPARAGAVFAPAPQAPPTAGDGADPATPEERLEP
jgi:hypoxanthine phosphoribosyltransferase